MNILFPADTRSRYPSNPYLIQLIEALSRDYLIGKVSYGADVLHWDPLAWDVIHIQWPEAVFGWKKPTWREVARVEARLKRHKRRSRVISTVHNHEPAPSFGELGEEVLEVIYANTDAFVHLGQASLDAFKERYKDRPWLALASHHIIPHGDYSYYLKLPQDPSLVDDIRLNGDSLILVFGALRSAEEEELARNAFYAAKLSRARLLFAGHASRATIPGEVLIGKLDRSDGRIIRKHKRIPDEQIRPLFEAATVVFIPRTGRLNSGVVPLAMTYGVPIVAPAEGVIGEMVTQGGGFLYEPGSVADAAIQLRRALRMSSDTRRALTRRMERYRSRELSWPAVARKHAQVYLCRQPIGRDSSTTSFRVQRLSRRWQLSAAFTLRTKHGDLPNERKAGIELRQKGRLNIVCFTVALNGYEGRFRDCLKTQERYCLRYGYRYWRIVDLPWRTTPQQSAWLKVEVMRGLLANGATHVGFLDADCEFRPHTPPFECEYPENTALLMAPGKSGRLNSGIMFGRSHKDLLTFLEMLVAKCDVPVPSEDRTAYENGHFIHYGKDATFIGLLDHHKWNNNTCLDGFSYIQHYSGGELRRWWDSNRKCISTTTQKEGAKTKEDVTGIPVPEFLRLARIHFSGRYTQLVSTDRRVVWN